MVKRRKNWDIVSKMDPNDTIKYRDVYEDQQLERSEIEEKETMTTRLIFVIIFTIISMILAYIAASFIQYSMSGFKSKADVNAEGQTGYQIADNYDYWNDNQLFDQGQIAAVVETCYSSYADGKIKEDSTAFSANGYSDVNPFEGYQDLSSEELLAKYFMYISVDSDGNAVVQQQSKIYSDEENPFTGYAELSAVEQAEKFCNQNSTGGYVFKSEYNYWQDNAEYQAWQLNDKLAEMYMNYRTGNFTPLEEQVVDESDTVMSYNPFDGYQNMLDTQMVDKFCNKVGSEGKYMFKDEYNFWNDQNTYWAYQIRDIIDEYYARYEVEYNGAAPVESPDQGPGAAETANQAKDAFFDYLVPNFWNVFFSLLVGFIVFGIMYTVMKKNLDAQNMLNDTTDINQYKNDQHIALPEEVQRKFDWFPDVGAHSPVQVSSMISHMMLQNKGINTVEMTVRHTSDVLDEDGEVDIYAGEPKYDDDDNLVTETLPMFDKDFAEDLFETSGLLEKSIRKYYDATKIPYNGDGRDRTKQAGKWNTVAEMINNTWHIPDYETQRPAGAYLVDTEPVNTMV